MDDYYKEEYFTGGFQLPGFFYAKPLMSTIKLARYKFAAKMLSSTDTVLDLGCGRGYGSYFFSKYSQKVTGIDLYSNLEEVDRSLKSKNLNFVRGDILAPSSEILKSKYSVVTAIDVIEHFYRNDGEKILEIYSNLLADNGMMIIGTPNKHSQAYRSEEARKSHFHEYKPDELMDLCRKYFKRTILFSMNDEIVHTGFAKLAWFLFVLCFK